MDHTVLPANYTLVMRCESQCDFGGKPAGERSHQPDDGLLLLPVKSAVTFTARQHHRPWAGTKLYCRVTEAHVC